MDFYIVDAFTDKPFGGNTAGVVLYNNCDEELMQRIASELKFSETAFIKQLSTDTFYIRYFTPNSEIALCGHATIASFYVLKYLNLVDNNKNYILKTNSEFLSVEIQNDCIFMETSTPKSGVCLENNIITALAKAMGVEDRDIGDFDFHLKPEIISTGLYDIMFPVKTSRILNSIKPDFKALSDLSKYLEVVGVHAFTINSSGYSANCRNFAPLYLINEECATGTSNASLTYYLYKNNVIKDFNRKYIFRQGEAMNRPSNIVTRLIVSNNIKILVGGTASIISKGQLLL